MPAVFKSFINEWKVSLSRYINTIKSHSNTLMNFPDGSADKKTACNAVDKGDTGSIPELGRLPEGGMAAHSSSPAGKIPWTEEPGGLQPKGSQRVRHK